MSPGVFACLWFNVLGQDTTKTQVRCLRVSLLACGLMFLVRIQQKHRLDVSGCLCLLVVLQMYIHMYG